MRDYDIERDKDGMPTRLCYVSPDSSPPKETTDGLKRLADKVFELQCREREWMSYAIALCIREGGRIVLTAQEAQAVPPGTTLRSTHDSATGEFVLEVVDKGDK